MKYSVCLYVCQAACLYVHLEVPEGWTAVSAAVHTACTSGLSQPILFTWTNLKEKLNDTACKGTEAAGKKKKRTRVYVKREEMEVIQKTWTQVAGEIIKKCWGR